MGHVTSITKGQERVAALDFTQPEVDKLKGKLLELTEATVWVRTGRDALGMVYSEVADPGVQLAATVKALEFAVGKPGQKLELTTPNTPGASSGLQDLGKLIAKNPEIAAKVLGALKDGLAMAQAIDVTGTSAENTSQAPESKSGGSHS